MVNKRDLPQVQPSLHLVHGIVAWRVVCWLVGWGLAVVTALTIVRFSLFGVGAWSTAHCVRLGVWTAFSRLQGRSSSVMADHHQVSGRARMGLLCWQA
jgi:hypothetical protein